MIHPGRDDSRARGVEISAEDLVPVPLHATEYRDVVLGLDVPQPHRVILVKILIMIFFFVNVKCYKFLGSSIAYL